MTPSSAALVADRLLSLAERDWEAASSWVGKLRTPQHTTLLIEACRLLDYLHVMQTFSKSANKQLSTPDFDVIVRGWNPLAGLLLPQVGQHQGVPLLASTPATLEAAGAILHQFGRSVLLRQASEMVRRGITLADFQEDTITLRMNEEVPNSLLFDRLEKAKLRELSGADQRSNELAHRFQVTNLDERIESLVFPWETNRGTMIGYDAELDIDNHFISLVMEATLDWRDEAGIHPHAKLPGCTGAELTSLALLLASFALKHIRFVDIGKRKIPRANYHMSLTIWKLLTEFSESICEITRIGASEAKAALDLLTVESSHASFFLRETTPFMPMLIKISTEHVLCPVSSIFRNPLEGARNLAGYRSPSTINLCIAPRESWMISELSHLFLGNRYRVIPQAVRLKRGSAIVTDIDCAVFDVTTGELALFQLKWQDFETSDLKKQVSKARNFTDQVDDWAARLEEWIAEFGTASLCQSLQLQTKPFKGQISLRLFAIGRSAARFSGYGIRLRSQNVAAATWSQFVRLRHEVGPAASVLETIRDRIMSDLMHPMSSQPLRFSLQVGEQKVIFEDIWRNYEDLPASPSN